jgi:hypothetical protein
MVIMNRLLMLVGVVLSIVMPSFAVVSTNVVEAGITYADARSYYEAHVNLAEPERERIQKHLSEAEADMRLNPPAGLNPTQMKNRLALLDSLAAYRVRGTFPQNLDFPERLIPYFIDAAGVPCAMGQLIIASGHTALAHDVRATMNNAYIAEIAAADPRLAAWSIAHGITLDEAARVQPAYGGPYNLANIAGMGRGPDGILWVLGTANTGLGGGPPGLAYRNPSGWKLDTSLNDLQSLCMRGNQPVVTLGNSGSFYWSRSVVSSATNALNGRNPYVCLWSASGDTLFVGTDRGLTRLNVALSRTGAYDSVLFGTTNPSVTTLARTPTSLWVGTTRGLARGMRIGGGFNWSSWDSTQLGGHDVTGLQSGRGDTVWVGLDSWRSSGELNRNYPYFSRRGIVRQTNSGPTAYRGGVLPSDTIFALAAHPQGGVWFATDSAFYRFTPPSNVVHIKPLPQYSPGSAKVTVNV